MSASDIAWQAVGVLVASAVGVAVIAVAAVIVKETVNYLRKRD